MKINKAMKAALKAISYRDIDLNTARRLSNLKAIDPLKHFYKTIDYKIYNDDYEVPLRMYLPDEADKDKAFDSNFDVILYIHGGGWVTESVETYNRVCLNLAQNTKKIVISIDYRLAPEFKFPTSLYDCYAVYEALFKHQILGVDFENITLMGDSAGGNLAAALSLMAHDKGDFMPNKQILLYPCLYNDYTNSPFESVKENGFDYLLTAKKLQQYVDYYKSSSDDLKNPYFAPLLSKSLKNQPESLIITAEYDPLRDEAEYYAKRLRTDGVRVKMQRLEGALHGFISLGPTDYHVKELYKLINVFLKKD